MKSFKNFSKRFLKNERGQGMVEYILLLVIVVAVVTIFKKPLMDMVNGKIEDLKGFGWEWASTGLLYKTMIRLGSRKVLLTSQKKLDESEVKDLSSQSKLSLSKNPLILRIEILDPFEQFVEYDSK